MRKPGTIILTLLCLGVCLNSVAHNIRQISSRNGLSNSAVICLFQDSERYLWVGTYDGLNRYDGAEIEIYKPDSRNYHSLSGNVIRKIVESKEHYLWIMTKGGLNLYSKKRDRVEAHFNEFMEDCSMACDSRGNFFILTQAGFLFYYDFDEGKIRETAVSNLRPTLGWINLIIDPDDTVWITNNGIVRRYELSFSENGEPQLERLGNFDHPHSVTHIYSDKGRIVMIDAQDDLYIVMGDDKKLVRNISSIVRQYGDIISIVFDRDDIIIGMRTSGVISLNSAEGYAVEKFPINYGVFSLLKDDVQDILWIGTDGQGVYAYVEEEYAFKGIALEELPLEAPKPVRAIHTDRGGDLWLGTKGDGIIKIRDYETAVEYDSRNVKRLTTADGLSSNSVFTFTESDAYNLLWIGSGGPGVNYYSYDDKKIHSLAGAPTTFVEVHGILEKSEHELWVSTLFSLFKLDIRKTPGGIETRRVRRFDFDVRDKQIFNKIYAICPENDSIMWLAMRGNGAIRLNNRSGEYSIVTFDDNVFPPPVNDILAIHRDNGGDLWFGSSYGINRLATLPDGTLRLCNYNEGLTNNTIHGILENSDGDLWFSSNSGLILFDRGLNTFRNFDQNAGLKVIEFSDNAYYKDPASLRCFFGGIDGVVWVEPGKKKNERFIPPILFTKLDILNEEANIDDFLVDKRGRQRLQLKYGQNFFTVFFSVNDFIDGKGKTFSYMLENFSDVWVNTRSQEAQFTKIPPGKYVLKVRYGDEAGHESQIATLDIDIRPPWYFGLVAKLFYALAAIGLIFLVYLYITKRYERKQSDMARELSQKYKEEMQENKLRFFTNITHEFCTPLTLIHTPSERILNYEGSDGYIRKYAHTIRSNSEKLNTLIQEIIDFRRMETGNKVRKIERCDINTVCDELMAAFTDLAEENSVDFRLDIAEGITWNTDRSCMGMILNNLVSNAFKYTQPEGEIRLTVGIEGGQLVLSVYNSGKGIRQEDIPYIFNRYSVLDNVGQNMIKGLSSRNGLGLTICKSMVELLEGTIEIESETGKYAKFIARFPILELPEADASEAFYGMLTGRRTPGPDKKSGAPAVNALPADVRTSHGTEEERSKILLVDDNEEILYMLKDILSEEYTVQTAKDGRDGIAQLVSGMPDLIITDVMMPGQDGISLTKEVKLDPHTMHIPVVIISAKSSIDDRIEGVELGADAYITKPFDLQYLKTIVRQLMIKHRKLREYYNSQASAFDYTGGQLLSKEGRDFIQSVIRTIDMNMANLDFSPEDLADNLSISLRTLYRRFKEYGLPTAKNLIKKQRIEYSARLLVSTNITIQEIMYSAGFTTRSHFYKEFIKRFNQSPKEYRTAGASVISLSDKEINSPDTKD